MTWALRKLTLTGAEAIPPAAGDDVYVGPGVYRETFTSNANGGSTYAVGTVTVTQGSTTVTGAGTAFLANVAVADLFQVTLFASGNDGVANGTATFTSAAGNFQANMIGKVVQINTRGAYGIGAVAAANSITLTDPNGLGWPAAAVGLNYSLMSGEGPYEIASITDDTNFELVRAWCAPTLTGLAYIAYAPIRYIADETGENTDGVGGKIRVTGSDNDQTRARNSVFELLGSYRLYRGFHLDSAIWNGMWNAGFEQYITVEDCVIQECGFWGVYIFTDCNNITFRRCVFGPTYMNGIVFDPAGLEDDRGHIIENCLFMAIMPWGPSVRIARSGGITVKNCTFVGTHDAVNVEVALTTGQTTVVNNCVIAENQNGLIAINNGEITEDFNDLSLNFLDRQNVAVGANSVAFPPLFEAPILYSGYKFPWWFSELSEWSQVRAIAGEEEACGDLRGFTRPSTSAKRSWGALQFTDMERDTTTPYAGVSCMGMLDAGRTQFKVPVAAESTTVEVWVHREANYAGVNPQLVIKQPGQADRITTDAGAAGAYNLLTDTFTPAALPPYIFIELVSNNTNGANIVTYWDNLRVG